MKTLAFLTLCLTLLISGCVNSLSTQTNAQTNTQMPKTVSPSLITHHYQCESGETIVATYPTHHTARIQYQENNYPMDIAVSASGARYVGHKLEWWTKGSDKGSEGTLLQRKTDNKPNEIIELCLKL